MALKMRLSSDLGKGMSHQPIALQTGWFVKERIA